MPPSSADRRLHYAYRGAAVTLEGDSLLPLLLPRRDGGGSGGGAGGAGGGGAGGGADAPWRPRLPYARSELRMGTVVHRPDDALLPGARPTRTVGPGAQLYVRTARWAYSVYLRPPCPPPLGRENAGGGEGGGEGGGRGEGGGGARRRCGRAGVVILDELLFDHEDDSHEATTIRANHTHYLIAC